MDFALVGVTGDGVGLPFTPFFWRPAIETYGVSPSGSWTCGISHRADP